MEQANTMSSCRKLSNFTYNEFHTLHDLLQNSIALETLSEKRRKCEDSLEDLFSEKRRKCEDSHEDLLFMPLVLLKHGEE